MERSEVGDRRPSAERDHDAAVDTLGQRVAPRRELPLGDLLTPSAPARRRVQ